MLRKEGAMAKKYRKEQAKIFQDTDGYWRISTNQNIWIDQFDTEEEATTYALRNGCSVEGC